MIVLTKDQRKALKRVYDRSPLWPGDHNRIRNTSQEGHAISYREFRKSVAPGYGCVMVKWCGMWLGIEPDGYTHS